MPSLQDVASAAGVSISTVSRVLNGAKLSDRISAACADKVRDAARQVGYTAGYHRRAIRSGKAETLGVSLEQNGPRLPDEPMRPSSLFEPYMNLIVAGVEQATHAVGYNLSLLVPSHKQRATMRGLHQIYDGQIDGMIIAPTNSRPENVQVLEQAPDLPIAAVLPAVRTQLPSVMYEPNSVIELPVHYLAGLGHRNLLYFGPTKERDSISRNSLFRKAAKRLGLNCDECLHDPSHDPASYSRWDIVERQMSALATYLSQNTRRFTAIVAFNDLAAISACRVLQKQGLRIPDDVSVTGIDNFDPAIVNPGLTTVDARLMEMGAIAGDLVLKMVNGGEAVRREYHGYQKIVAPQLVVRDSTGPVSRANP